jgi:putative SOS response-associated peptidase YedK
MCNTYAPAEPPEILEYFDALPPVAEYRPNLGPWQHGPYVRPLDGGRRQTVVGMWALVADNAVRLPRPGDAQTNNCRSETMAAKRTFKGAWARAQRCLIPARSFDEPRYLDGVRNTWWQFKRKDGKPWCVAGLWNDWIDKSTREVVGTYTMLTMNADAHPLMSLMHKPEVDPKTGVLLPPEKQDKRSIVLLEREHWDTWLHGSNEEALQLIRLPAAELFDHGPRPAPERPPKVQVPPPQSSLL